MNAALCTAPARSRHKTSCGMRRQDAFYCRRSLFWYGAAVSDAVPDASGPRLLRFPHRPPFHDEFVYGLLEAR